MGWASATKNSRTKVAQVVARAFDLAMPVYELATIEWSKLVSLDFETYYDEDYTLAKYSTSEYVRDPRFKAQMVGIKIGRGKTRIYTGAKIKAAIKAIDWSTHDLLCHNNQFDGFIMHEHYGVVPRRYYCTLSMARGLHSNEIGAGLHDVSVFYGGEGKIEGALEQTKGVLNWSPALVKSTSLYCARDVDEMYRIFCEMVKVFPAKEIALIDMTIRMFCDPVLRVDIPRVTAEYHREVAERKRLLLTAIDPKDYADPQVVKLLLKTRDERALVGDERNVLIAKRVLGSNERFCELLRECGVEPPMKISPAWIKKNKVERAEAVTVMMAKKPELTEQEAERACKLTYAFAKDDLRFRELPDLGFDYHTDLNPNKKADLAKLLARQDRLTQLVEARIATKSTTNITRAERFIKAGANGQALPVGYAYYRAHTGRWGGNNKMNMQNLKRGGELRQCILAAPGHHMVVCDSGQIEARVNGWLWGQKDLIEGFAQKRDVYSEFASKVYGRTITKANPTERHIGKTCILGLGYMMGAAKLQLTLARGNGGPSVIISLDEAKRIVNLYRSINDKIAAGWKVCSQIIEDMAAGVSGAWKCIRWSANKIELPNGMCLKYPDMRKERNEDTGWDEWTYQSGDIRKKIYGGLLCENLVQALARIIVAEQMLMINGKYRVVMTTHDEAVAHVKKAQGDAAFKFMLKCMTTPLHWCEDIPLAGEGGHAPNYSK
jgi:hypothetical protein